MATGCLSVSFALGENIVDEPMTDFLRHCTGGQERGIAAGTELLEEGHSTGHLYILLDGRLEVIKAGATVAVVSEPGALFGEMSLLPRAHS